MAKKKMIDDEFSIIHNNILKIRARPSMFISSLGEAGIFHLCKELIDNASDEALKENSPCDAFTIELTNKYIRVYDNGRGIPTDKLQEVYETLQAGSNMVRAGGTTKGENGAGSTCILALSSYLKIISSRPTEKKRLTLIYHEAELKERILEDYNGDDHGLDVTFKPSKIIMGDDNIPVELVVNWIKDFDYLINPKTNVRYIVNGKEHHVHHKELYQFFDSYGSKETWLCNTLVVDFDGGLEETIMGKSYNRMFHVEVAIVYSNPDVYKGEDIRHSWMNMIHTVDNGSHVDGVIRGFAKYLQEQVWRKNKRLDGEDLKKDILAHLNIVVKAETDMAMMFSSQAKHRVFSKELGNKIAEAVYEELSSHRYDVIDEMIDVVIGNHRARVEGEKARNVNALTKQKKQWTNPDAYIPCSSVKTEYPKEIFLVEGNSAGGGLRGARDARYQAILKFRGKNLNPWDEDLERVLKSVPWLNLVKVLGCGIGPTFDIKKLNFDKIIITTDADIDGYHIRVEFLSFFAKFMPELIYEGKVYIAEPPLYQLVRGKDISYVASQTEYLEKCIDSIGDIEIDFPGMGME